MVAISQDAEIAALKVEVVQLKERLATAEKTLAQHEKLRMKLMAVIWVFGLIGAAVMAMWEKIFRHD